MVTEGGRLTRVRACGFVYIRIIGLLFHTTESSAVTINGNRMSRYIVYISCIYFIYALHAKRI